MSERNKRIRSGHYERRVALDASQANEEARTVPASLSSEHEYERWFGREVLVHDDASVDLSRAKSGLPLLLGHDASAHVIGRVDNVRIEDRRLRGDLVEMEDRQHSVDGFAEEERRIVACGQIEQAPNAAALFVERRPWGNDVHRRIARACSGGTRHSTTRAPTARDSSSVVSPRRARPHRRSPSACPRLSRGT